ncbi:MAG: hypothetical protein BroJett040_04860 [Oligoflexia bacterium]|nr:MAG: hypothetical protein BroJett040_04860 [Oligoflexia bacterium]
MTRHQFISSVSSLLLGFFLLGSIQAHAGTEVITPADAAQMVSKNQAILVDVRELQEVQQGMAQPAQHMPLSEMEKNSDLWQKFLAGTSKEKAVIVYCRSGRRSEIVGTKMQELGYKVKNMGGFEGWVKAGLPVKKP